MFALEYILNNKAAWEEAFENRREGWGDDNHEILKNGDLSFFNEGLKEELLKIKFAGKDIAHFCCNNGRELLTLMQLGAKQGFGFDIAENIVDQAQKTAKKADIQNCEFHCCNLLELPDIYNEKFDFIFFTIGAITWFEDLNLLFEKVSKCLKENGVLLINDFHPLANMLPLPDEEYFDGENLNRLTYSYFTTMPWIENDGMSYMTDRYESKTFTSFSHPLSNIINSLSENGLKTVKFCEYDYDIGFCELYNGLGFPMSYTLIAQKY